MTVRRCSAPPCCPACPASGAARTRCSSASTRPGPCSSICPTRGPPACSICSTAPAPSGSSLARAAELGIRARRGPRPARHPARRRPGRARPAPAPAAAEPARLTGEAAALALRRRRPRHPRRTPAPPRRRPGAWSPGRGRLGAPASRSRWPRPASATSTPTCPARSTRPSCPAARSPAPTSAGRGREAVAAAPSSAPPRAPRPGRYAAAQPSLVVQLGTTSPPPCSPPRHAQPPPAAPALAIREGDRGGRPARPGRRRTLPELRRPAPRATATPAGRALAAQLATGAGAVQRSPPCWPATAYATAEVADLPRRRHPGDAGRDRRDHRARPVRRRTWPPHPAARCVRRRRPTGRSPDGWLIVHDRTFGTSYLRSGDPGG